VSNAPHSPSPSLPTSLPPSAYRRTTQRATAFVELLGKGQFPSDRDFLIEQSVDLIYEDVKYQVGPPSLPPSLQLLAMQTAPGSFLLACNGSTVDAEIRSLADGGYLVIIGGKSHVAYMKDEAGGEDGSRVREGGIGKRKRRRSS